MATRIPRPLPSSAPRRHRRTCGLLAAVALALVAGPARTAGLPVPRPIEFLRGTSAAAVHGGIARGAVAYYRFGAAQWQWAEANVTSVEDNAVVTVYAPGWRLVPGDGGAAVEGDVVPSMVFGRDDSSHHWAALLYESGEHLLAVGSLRGGAEYDLELAIRTPADEDCGELPQQPMNACTGAVAAALERERERTERAVAAALDAERRPALAAAEAAWKSYRDAQCELEAAGFEGGSMQPTIRNGCVAGMTRRRLEELRALLALEGG